MKLQELLDSIGLQCGAGLVSRPKTFDTKAKEWQDTAFHWRVTLKLEGRQYETDYWCGWAHAKGMPPVIRTQYHEQLALKATPIPPKSADVVHSLLHCQESGKAMRRLLGKHFAAVRGRARLLKRQASRRCRRRATHGANNSGTHCTAEGAGATRLNAPGLESGWSQAQEVSWNFCARNERE